MEIKNKLTVTRGELGEDNEGKGTCTKDPHTRTMGWGLSLGAGLGWHRGEKGQGEWGQL